MSAVASTEVFAFAGFSLDPRQRLLFSPEGRPIPLTARAFDTLLYLVEHPNELIEKQTLMKAIWPNVIVEENNLNQNISAVRRALGETPGEHRFVVTVPGRGFRFVPAVRRVSSGVDPEPVAPPVPQTLTPVAVATAATVATPGLSSVPAGITALLTDIPRTWWVAGVAVICTLLVVGILALWLWPRGAAQAPGTGLSFLPAPVASVAVLPFLNLTGDPSKEYFSDGLAEELTNELSLMPGLKVPASTSSFAYKGRNVDVREIGRELGVSTVLEGSVRSAGARIRVTAQLVNAKTGFQIWARSYDRNFGDVFKLEDDISAQIVDALNTALHAELPNATAPPQPTRDAEAYRLYLQANAAADADTAIRLYSQAIGRDPGFARAYAARAVRRIRSIAFGNVIPGAIMAAERDATQAIALDPNIASAHVALGMVNAAHGDWLAAESSLRKAMQLAPNDPLGHLEYAVLVLDSVGHMRRSLEETQLAYDLNPAGVTEIADLAAVYNLMGMEPEALKYADLAVELGVRDTGASILTAAVYGTAAIRGGDYNDAVSRSLSPAMQTPEATAVVKLVFAAFHNPRERPAADRELQKLAQQIESLGPAQHQREPLILWPVLLGDLNFAFQSANRWIDTEQREGSVGFSWGFLWMPEMRPFRADPRFQTLVARLKLFDYWREYGPPDNCDLVGEHLACR